MQEKEFINDLFITHSNKINERIFIFKCAINTKICSNVNIFDNELEIDELASLFKSWTKENSNNISNGTISEENILKILIHFFPNIEIIEDKYVLNVTSKMWNKLKDIDEKYLYFKLDGNIVYDKFINKSIFLATI